MYIYTHIHTYILYVCIYIYIYIYIYVYVYRFLRAGGSSGEGPRRADPSKPESGLRRGRIEQCPAKVINKHSKT